MLFTKAHTSPREVGSGGAPAETFCVASVKAVDIDDAAGGYQSAAIRGIADAGDHRLGQHGVEVGIQDRYSGSGDREDAGLIGRHCQRPREGQDGFADLSHRRSEQTGRGLRSFRHQGGVKFVVSCQINALDHARVGGRRGGGA